MIRQSAIARKDYNDRRRRRAEGIAKGKCLQRHSGVLLDPELTEYALGLAKADCYREAIDVLGTLENPNTPRALN
jgi:hypothetical protein